MNSIRQIRTMVIFLITFFSLYGCATTPKRDIPVSLPEDAPAIQVDVVDREIKDWKNEAINEFSLKRNEIYDSFLAGNYSQVVTLCLELEKEFGSNSLTPEIAILLSLSMAENGMLQEGIDLGASILEELHSKPDLINLMAEMISWELKLGNREKALELYEKLLDNIHEKNAILDNAGKSIRAEERLPYEPEIDRDAIGAIDKARSAEVQGLLDVVERLIKNESYADAKLLLLKWRLRAEEGPETELIEQALKKVEYAETGGNNKLDNEMKILNEARDLIEGERYEEAISSLESIIPEGGKNNQEVMRLKELAIEKLIEREHLAAARSFLMAKKSSDPLEKETLLKSSLEILNMLIEKYPSSPSINKINNHITRVSNELDKLTEK